MANSDGTSGTAPADQAGHPDASIFSAARAVREAEAACTLIAAQLDYAASSGKGGLMNEEELDALDEASSAIGPFEDSAQTLGEGVKIAHRRASSAPVERRTRG